MKSVMRPAVRRQVSAMGASLLLGLLMTPIAAHSIPFVSSYSLSGHATATQTGPTSTYPRANGTPVPVTNGLDLSTVQPKNELTMQMNLFGIAQGTLKTNASTSQPQSKISAVVTGTSGETARVKFLLEARVRAFAKCRHPLGAAKAEAVLDLSQINQTSVGSNPLPALRAFQEVLSDANRPPCSEDDEPPPGPLPDDSGVIRFVVSRDITFTTSQVTVDFPFSMQLNVSGNNNSPLCPSIGEAFATLNIADVTSYQVAVAPSSERVLCTGTSSPITATVYRLPGGTPIPGELVIFSTTLGSVNPTSAVTDSNGQASTTLIAGNTAGTGTLTAASRFTSASLNVCVVDPGPIPASVGGVNYIENLTGPSPLDEGWGQVTSPPANNIVDITPYFDCDAKNWKCKVTRMDSKYNIWWRLLPGVDEATVAAATTKEIYCKMRSDLEEIVDNPGIPNPEWYMLKAVEAHERVHVAEWKRLLDPRFNTMKAQVEALSVDHVCGKTAAQAKAEIKALPAYIDAVVEMWLSADDAWDRIDDPNDETRLAELAGVLPMIMDLDAKAAANGWTCP